MPGNNYVSGETGIVYDQICRDMVFVTEDATYLYAFGGVDWNWTGDTEVYSRSDKMAFVSRAWSSIAPMPVAKAYGQGVRLSGKHHVIGGSNFFDDYPTNSIWLPWYGYSFPYIASYFTSNYQYAAATDAWEFKQDADVGRYHDRIFALNNVAFRMMNQPEVYEFGGPPGYDPHVPYDYLTAFNGYSETSDTWAAYQNMLRGRVRHSAGELSGKGVIGPGESNVAYTGDVIGGSPSTYRTNVLERFDPVANAWSYWIEDNTPYVHLGTSGCFCGGQGYSLAFAWHYHWVSINSETETIQEINDRVQSGERDALDTAIW
jgi:hypothetical protein